MSEVKRELRFSTLKVTNIFNSLTVKYHISISVTGFVIIFVFTLQLISGIMVSFSLVPECMLIPTVRDEEDLEDLYTDDFFWLHERGVDMIFIFSYVHLARKLYLINFYLEQEISWKSGVILLLLIQVVTFLGLVLCCTHLSDITLKIAANTIHTLAMMKTKVYWWLFTDKNLNTDTIIRLAYAHYCLAFVLYTLAVLHAIDMHHDWKSDVNHDSLKNELQWWNEVFLNEIYTLTDFFMFLFLICIYLYSEPEALSYEIFMWGDVGAITEPKFNQVAPHWYFRPLMSFLLVIPHAILGIFGLVMFFVVLYFQISIHKAAELKTNKIKVNNIHILNKYNVSYNTTEITNGDSSLTYQMMFYFFICACLYTTTFLPNGKYYQLLGGNMGMLFSYFYILVYLFYPNVRYINISTLYKHIIKTKVLGLFFYKKIS